VSTNRHEFEAHSHSIQREIAGERSEGVMGRSPGDAKARAAAVIRPGCAGARQACPRHQMGMIDDAKS